MDGDPRNQGLSLLKKYDIPIEHLSYDYAEKCTNKKELEKIIRILRSGEEGSYPALLKVVEERLKLLAPDSRVLRVETPIITKDCITKEEWDAVENELLCWEKEMNVMDKSLEFEKSRIEVLGNKHLPEVREVDQKNILQKAEQISKMAAYNNNSNIKKNSNNKTNNMRIKSGDYGAWDKYDVDKELLRIDVEEERKQELNETKKRQAKKLEKEKKFDIAKINKENYSLMEQQVLANQAKDRGNECYKSGDLKNALKYYEISIKLYPTANVYNNRAMTYLKLEQFEKALEDTNKVLHLEKNNIKALYRRATAYQNIQSNKENNNYNELALQDFHEIIRLEPNNKVAQAEIQNLKKKLNKDNSGEKFRMPISEGLFSSMNFNQNEEKNLVHNIQDNFSIEKLPLTYYGPSTSTFMCEPYSMVHRALSGSSTPGRVLCKCNSNIPRQNPLCQKCGEAMCSPKPSKAVKAKSEVKFTNEQDKGILKADTNVSNCELSVKNEMGRIENSSVFKSQPEVSSETLKQQKEKSTALENQRECDNNVNEFNKNNSVCYKETKEAVVLTESDSISTKVDNSEKESSNCKIISQKTIKNPLKKAVAEKVMSLESKELKNTEIVCCKNYETISATNSSSQNVVNHSVKKSKNKKNKSKETEESKLLRKHLETFKTEPVRVVYADKYVHRTSVEPKIKSQASADLHQESALLSDTQYKAFVPNKTRYSPEYKNTDASVATGVSSSCKAVCSLSDKGGNDLSSEANKENFLGNCRSNSVTNGRKEDVGEEAKREIVSAYEFMKAWEELKKLDNSYIKRAEIIRKIKPSDFDKVIGIKLDSDMLSGILECLLRHLIETEPLRVVELLNQLPRIPRFELISLFLADSDKQNIKKLIQVAESKGFKLNEDVKKNLIAHR